MCVVVVVSDGSWERLKSEASEGSRWMGGARTTRERERAGDRQQTAESSRERAEGTTSQPGLVGLGRVQWTDTAETDPPSCDGTALPPEVPDPRSSSRRAVRQSLQSSHPGPATNGRSLT